MCEPFHSITQFPAISQEEGRFTSPGDNLSVLLSQTLQAPIITHGLALRDNAVINVKSDPFSNLGVEIDEFVNFSRLGLGHSESMEVAGLSRRKVPQLPDDTRYEVAWWERRVRIDGHFKGGPKWVEQQAFKSAEKYAQLSSIGNLSIFRRFLEQTVRKTTASRRACYFMRVLESLLTVEGRQQLYYKLQQAMGGQKGVDAIWSMEKLDADMFDRCVSAMLGFTRKRHLLVPEWADDDSLWVRKSAKGNVLEQEMNNQILVP